MDLAIPLRLGAGVLVVGVWTGMMLGLASMAVAVPGVTNAGRSTASSDSAGADHDAAKPKRAAHGRARHATAGHAPKRTRTPAAKVGAQPKPPTAKSDAVDTERGVGGADSKESQPASGATFDPAQPGPAAEPPSVGDGVLIAGDSPAQRHDTPLVTAELGPRGSTSAQRVVRTGAADQLPSGAVGAGTSNADDVTTPPDPDTPELGDADASHADSVGAHPPQDVSTPQLIQAPTDLPKSIATVAPAAALTAPTGPKLINVIGTFFFGLFDLFTRIVQGPPSVPAGSTVRVGRSTLQIDCGDGYTAAADWYFPSDPEPDRIIYFQHGFGASAGFYNATAAELAERNNAIVVAPTITANLFACDGCQLAGDQMHAAVAKLFLDRAALLDSAQAAGFQGTELPERFILSGHSEGGLLAEGAAGYFEQFASDDMRHQLAGVLLLETQAGNGTLSRALAKIPDDIPVLHVAAKPNFFDTWGDASEALEAARPGQFNGVQLIGGRHSDAFRTSNRVIQFVVSLVTGFSTRQNVDAVQILAQGWIDDMYADTVYDADQRTGLYGAPSTVIDIPTEAGTAHAYVLPTLKQLNPIQRILQVVLQSAYKINFATCAQPPEAPKSLDGMVSPQPLATASCSRDI